MEVYPGPGRAFDDRFWKNWRMTRTTNRRGNAAPGRARGPDFPRPDEAGFPLNFRTAAKYRPSSTATSP